MLNRLRSALSGRYVIERELGRGAMAVVYLAHDLKHGRRVALKVIEPDVASTLGTARFLHEIRTTARLNHPHILPLFDSGEAAGFLYYTMPAVAGETLRQRLDRDGRASLPDMLRLGAQIADALAHAHSYGIVHRDIKPENILLTPEGHVWVVDFGLARALASAADQRVTSVGGAVGSPLYMSPEQAAGEERLDGRSDVYSLACVLFEACCGEPPYTAASVPALLARHLSEPAPALADRCPEAPPHVDAALRRGMAKDPAHRFRDARDLIAALHDPAATNGEATPPLHVRSTRHRWFRPGWRGLRSPRGIAALLLTLALLSVVTLTGLPSTLLADRDGAGADTTSWLVLPITGGDNALPDRELLAGVFARWRELHVVRLESGSASLDVSSADDAARLARRQHAGRAVYTVASRVGDSLRLRATLVTANGEELTAHTVRLPRGSRNWERHLVQLADALLFPGYPLALQEAAATDSRAAQLAYLRGRAAITEWDLTAADSLFAAAVRSDPNFGRAHAWRAQALFWREGLSASARRAAERAIGTNGPESEPLAAALLDLASDDFPAACARYHALLKQDPQDYAAVRGLADCHGLDRLVIADPRSRTGWSFRASGHQALRYHRRAFELLPASHRAYRAGRFLQLRNSIFYTALSAQRSGVDAGGESYLARPSWAGDTLAFYPVREQDVQRGAAPGSESAVTAVLQLQGIFLEVTSDWVSAFPTSPDALEAHAIAMELKGDTRALETIGRARRFAADPVHAANLSISEFWLRLKRSVPASPADARAARVLADSLLARPGRPGAATLRRLAAIAAVTGRAHLAASLARQGEESGRYPPAVAQAGAALLAYAAVGGPADSVRVYERAVEATIRNLVHPGAQASARAELLGRAAPLALPACSLRILGSGELADDYYVRMLQASKSGSARPLRAAFAAVAANRRAYRAADLKLESLLPEASLLFQAGDARAAHDWLTPTLDALRYIEPGGLESVAAAGPLARALLLRAEIALVLGDTASAAQWASIVTELWTHADPELRALQLRARELARMKESR